MIDASEARRRLAALIDSQSTLVLSTAGAGGPAGAPLFYVPCGDLRLCWLSSPRSRHSENLASANGAAAVSIHAATFRWEEILGAQLTGTVEVVEAQDERARILAAYRERFDLGPSFDRAIGSAALYRFTPTRARLLDNGLGFPGKVELDPGTPADQAG